MLCPNAYGFQRRTTDTQAIGIGFRVNYAGPDDQPNVKVCHADDYGDGLVFVVLPDGVEADDELLFLPDQYNPS